MPLTFFTANLNGSPDGEQVKAVLSADADLLLLTEVPTDLEVTSYDLVASTTEPFGMGVAFAAVYSRVGGAALNCPDVGTASAVVGDLAVWSSVLPWRAAGDQWPGDKYTGKARSAIAALSAAGQVPTVWGGDWNQEMTMDTCFVGSKENRAAIDALLEQWKLDLPTRDLRNKAAGPTIDHIAVAKALGRYGAEPVKQGFKAKEHYGYLVRPKA